MSRVTEEWYTEYIAERRKGAEDRALAKDIPDPGPESNLQAKVLRYCKEHGYPCFHDRSRKMNAPGWPDNLIFLPEGHVVLIELKAEGGKLRLEQKSLQLTLRWLKHEVYIVRSFKMFVEIIDMKIRGGCHEGTAN